MTACWPTAPTSWATAAAAAATTTTMVWRAVAWGGAGGGGDDAISGTDGNDVIFGDGSGGGGGGNAGGMDALGRLGGAGGGGADTIDGGAGNDILFGDGFDGDPSEAMQIIMWFTGKGAQGGLGGGIQALVGVRDHQLDATQTTPGERAQEGHPEGLGLRMARWPCPAPRGGRQC